MSEIQIVCFLLTRLISLLLMVEIEWYIVLFYQEKFCVVLDNFEFWDIDMYVLIQFSLIYDVNISKISGMISQYHMHVVNFYEAILLTLLS